MLKIKMLFSAKTKNLNWKDGMGLKMKNFNIMGVHWKIRILGGCMINQYVVGDLFKKGVLDSLQI